MKSLAYGIVIVLAAFGGCSADAPSTVSTSASGTSSSSGAGIVGRCWPGCTTAADCCEPAQIDCPNGTYPNNPTCDNGHCLPPQCSTTADCTPLGTNFDCLSTLGINNCGIVCTQNADCLTGTECTGVDGNGKKFCRKTGPSNECVTDADCAGRGTCINTNCRCTSNADCTHPTYDTCISG